MEDDNISVHLERLAQSDPALAQNIKNAMSKLASERDAANERARQSIIADQRTLQQKAEDEILAERRAVRHYEVPEKGHQWLARHEFDAMTTEQKWAAMRAGVRLID